MENGSWIKLNRKLLESPLMKRPLFAWLWVVLLLKANHKDTEFIWNDKKQVCKRGQLLTGRKQLSIESGISESQIERILKYLEDQQQIEQQKTNKFRLILIKNYDKYQDVGQQKDNKRTTKGQQKDTNNNDNKDNNDNNIDSSQQADTPAKVANSFLNDMDSEYRKKFFNEMINKGLNDEEVRKETLKFISYWTEPTKSGNKQRWEIEKTFEIGRRLATWFSRTRNFQNNKKITSI
jgi:hypothetical protein